MIQLSLIQKCFLPRYFSPFLLVALSLFACDTEDPGESVGDGDVPAGDGDGDASTGDGDATEFETPSGVACAASERLGTFTIDLADDYTSVRGAVADGVTPSGVPEILAEDGSCRLLNAPNLFCDPACGSGLSCGADGMCHASPSKVSAGTLSVSGLAVELSLQPNAITGDYSKTFQTPYPGFEPAAQITLKTSGDVLPEFTLFGLGVELISSSHASFPVESGVPAEISWTPPLEASEHVNVNVSLTVNAHGGTSAWIECTGPDTGTLTIPSALTSGLFELGLSGFPRVTITRQSIDDVDVDEGCVDLAVSSALTVSVDVPGLVSCSDDEDCASGETCQPELVCAE